MSDSTPAKKTPRKAAVKKPVAANANGVTKPRQARTKSATGDKPPAKRVTNNKKRVAEKPPRRFMLVIVSALLLTVLSLSTWVYLGLYQRVNIPATGYKLSVERGQFYADVLVKLDQDKVLPSTMLAKLYLKVSKPKALQTGTYLFKPPLTALSLLRQLTHGQGLIMNKITIIEGSTFKQLRAQLKNNGDVKQTISSLSDSEVLALIGASEPHPEGLFAPDTYIFAVNESDVKILKRLYQQQQQIVDKAWANRAPNLPYKNAYEALIMASIVEKETGNKIERPAIAGVFVRRLQQGMRLQTDPTVIYGLGDSYNGNIRKADLLAFTEYNTYRINGLPPTPIALPSKAAIEAALHPAAGDAVYFVAKGDGSGTHNFSATLSQHNQAVNAYLQARKGQ